MNKQTEFLPFHAINEFMRADFRLNVVRDTLNSLPNLSEEHNTRINRLIKKLIKVPGFRNSEKAPAMLKIIPTSKSFEKSPELVAAILSAWAELNSDLALRVFNMLIDRGWSTLSTEKPFSVDMISKELLQNWPIFPLDFDRTKLPGFYIRWPKGEDYENLYNQFKEVNSDIDASIDKVSLMAVWLSLRLPYQMEEVENAVSENNDQSI